MTPPPPLPGDAAPQPAIRIRWLAVVLAVAVLAAGGLYIWLTSDSAAAFEDELTTSFDERWERQSDPSWCEGTCSDTGHEWHADDDLETVLTLVREDGEIAGMAVEETIVGEGAALVRLSRGDQALEVGITSPVWGRASGEASGTAIWFTSLSVFDENAGF